LEIIKNQKSIIDSIIFVIDEFQEQQEGIIFFLTKDLVVIGNFTPEIGIK
tara:strand:+ start:280 stop:429 length:150 start_codon:yes stop_codon:yes gene_type:complete